MPLPDKESFFKKFNVDTSSFEQSNLEWADLEAIHDDYIKMSNTLLKPQLTSVVESLHNIDRVHSIRYRIKDPEHLIEKIIRKCSLDSERKISIDNYYTEITDLIGIRAIHLYKCDWKSIHDFITTMWKPIEKPKYYHRAGDSQQYIQEIKDNGIEAETHPVGYRSIHYTMRINELQGKPIICEIQVRTIFEEGWSEIDHQIRYPYFTEDKLSEEFLQIFNRLAGSADEMGTFIRNLKQSYEQANDKIPELANNPDVQKLTSNISTLTTPLSKSDQPNPLNSFWGGVGTLVLLKLLLDPKKQGDS